MLGLAGCATAPAPRAPETTKVAVSVSCLGDTGVRPLNTFNHGDYPGEAAAAKAALVDAAAWEGYAIGLEVAMSGCAKKTGGDNFP